MAGGHNRLEGDLPVNTNGGGLSYRLPGIYSVFLLTGAVRQLRGERGERQMNSANTVIVHGDVGVLSAQAIEILGSGATL